MTFEKWAPVPKKGMKNDFFWSEIRSGFGEQGTHPPGKRLLYVEAWGLSFCFFLWLFCKGILYRYRLLNTGL